MCAHFSVGLIFLSPNSGSSATQLSPGVTAPLEGVDLAGNCGQKSVFHLLARSSTEGGATQLSLRLGPSDRPVNHEKAG